MKTFHKVSAYVLSPIFPRTVETYLNQIKEKAGISFKAKLIDHFIEQNQSFFGKELFYKFLKISAFCCIVVLSFSLSTIAMELLQDDLVEAVSGRGRGVETWSLGYEDEVVGHVTHPYGTSTITRRRHRGWDSGEGAWVNPCRYTKVFCVLILGASVVASDFYARSVADGIAKDSGDLHVHNFAGIAAYGVSALCGGRLIGKCCRPRNNPTRACSAVLNTIIGAANTAVAWFTAVTIQNDIIQTVCDTNSDGSQSCARLKPSEVKTCENLLLIAGIMNVYAMCRSLYSTFRCSSTPEEEPLLES